MVGVWIPKTCYLSLKLTTHDREKASGRIPPFDLAKIQGKNVSIMRSVLDAYIATREELEFYANSVLGSIKSGKLKIKIHKIYPFKDVVQAHKDLESRKTTGKLLLMCPN